MRTVSAVVLATFLSLSLAACGDDSATGPDGDGDGASFDVTISNGVSTSFTGAAIFESGVSGGGVSGFGVVAVDTEQELQSFSLVRRGTRPSSGQYSLADPEQGTVEQGEFVVVISYANDADDQVVLGSTGGTVTIDESSSSRVSGSFEAQLTGAVVTSTGADSVSATATGSFDAVEASEFGATGG